ncbi:hypothetical protein AWH03_03525 [Brucella suis 019]|nr:hypothetical protein AWH03_03525 [Brucella suis 019]KPZ80793.1 hypothetical protein AKO52_10840 [Brucella abortus]
MRQRTLGRNAEEHVRILHGVGKRAAIGLYCMGRFPLVHALFTALIDDALGVAQDDVFGSKTHGLDKLDTGDAGRAGTVADELCRLHVAARKVQCVDKARSRDDGRAMLVVVEDGNVHQFAQAALDDEAIRRLDVFKVDAAEGGAEIADRIDESVDIGRIDFKINGIDVGKTLEQHSLAFHHRLGGKRAQIAEAEDRGAIGNDGDEIALGRIVIGAGGIFGYGLHRHGHARRIGERQVALRGHRLGRVDFQLAGAPLSVKVERFLLTGCGCAF